jgi:hypothetical protein
LVQETGDSVGRYEDSGFCEKGGDFASRSATPFQPGHRIAGCVVLQEHFNGGDYLRRFFALVFARRPPDACDRSRGIVNLTNSAFENVH